MKFEHLYVHIPFCVSKCNYCDFISYPLARHADAAASYTQLLRQELALWRKQATLGPWQSIYIGGGTPSLLPAEDIATLLGELMRGKETVDNDDATRPVVAEIGHAYSTEITLEANPDSITAEKLRIWRQAGINRLSIGVQSFDDGKLTAMGRPHNAAQLCQALEQARQAGFDNISIDLIYGLPGQTVTDWQDELRQALELGVEHISLYGLSLSLDSPWGCALAEGKLSLPEDDASADMLEAAISTLPGAGYAQYEISNFSRPGYESQHNCAYWRRENYLGLGAAAASCAGERRWFNERDLAAYAATLADDKLPMIEKENLSIEEVLGEAMFLGLRLTAGIELAEFTARYGTSPERYYKRPLAKLLKAGLVELADGHLRLTEKGLLLGNEVFLEFM